MNKAAAGQCNAWEKRRGSRGPGKDLAGARSLAPRTHARRRRSGAPIWSLGAPCAFVSLPARQLVVVRFYASQLPSRHAPPRSVSAGGLLFRGTRGHATAGREREIAGRPAAGRGGPGASMYPPRAGKRPCTLGHRPGTAPSCAARPCPVRSLRTPRPRRAAPRASHRGAPMILVMILGLVARIEMISRFVCRYPLAFNNTEPLRARCCAAARGKRTTEGRAMKTWTACSRCSRP